MSYPVTFEADFVERRSRLTTFFRLILLIPLLIVAYVYGILAFFALIIAWFAIVITGRYPERALRVHGGVHALRHARARLRSAALRRLSALLGARRRVLSGAHALHSARSLQPPEDASSASSSRSRS